MYKTRLTSNEIFSQPYKIHRAVGRAKDLSAPRVYVSNLRVHLQADSCTYMSGIICLHDIGINSLLGGPPTKILYTVGI